LLVGGELAPVKSRLVDQIEFGPVRLPKGLSSLALSVPADAASGTAIAEVLSMELNK